MGMGATTRYRYPGVAPSGSLNIQGPVGGGQSTPSGPGAPAVPHSAAQQVQNYYQGGSDASNSGAINDNRMVTNYGRNSAGMQASNFRQPQAGGVYTGGPQYAGPSGPPGVSSVDDIQAEQRRQQVGAQLNQNPNNSALAGYMMG